MLNRKEVLQQVTAQIEALLAQGSLPPWHRPWVPSATGGPHNPVSQKSFTGLNHLYLDILGALKGFTDPRWMTYRQAAERGWQVRKGEKGESVFRPVLRERKKGKAKNDGDASTAPDESGQDDNKTCRYLMFVPYTVFNAAQIDGIPPLVIPEAPTLSAATARKAAIIQALAAEMNVPVLESPESNRAYYLPQEDRIVMPDRARFKIPDLWDNTCLHELAHATGHSSRLKRDQTGAFGSVPYAAEEVAAETCAWLLSRQWGIAFDPGVAEMTEEQHTAYIAQWGQRLPAGSKALSAAIEQGLLAAQFLDKRCEAAVEKGQIERPPVAVTPEPEGDASSPEETPEQEEDSPFLSAAG